MYAQKVEAETAQGFSTQSTGGGQSEAIDRRSGLSPAEFVRDYVLPRRPVILTDATSVWPARTRWTPEFFQENFGTKRIQIDGKDYLLGEFIHQLQQSTDDKPAPYFRNVRLHKAFPKLVSDVEQSPVYFQPNWLHSRFFMGMRRLLLGGGNFELFIGGAGRSFPVLHYDAPGAHSFICQIYGRKLFVLYPPEQSRFLYPKPDQPHISQIEDIDHPDLERFPLFAQATPIKIVLEPGDTLFMPCNSWHTARMLTTSITLGLDMANESNWENVKAFLAPRVKKHYPLLASPFLRYLNYVGILQTLAGRTARRNMSA